MSEEERIVNRIVEMLETDETLLEDARIGAPLGNSAVGSVVNLTDHVPRQYAEQYVLEALRRIDAQRNRTD